MLPTIASRGDIVVVDKLSPRWSPYQRGDVVICSSPHQSSGVVCKRIVAMAGDTVTLHSGLHLRGLIKIPPGHVWLEGDNARNSTDSRSYGPVPLPLLRGRVVGRVWPPDRTGRLAPHVDSARMSVITATAEEEGERN
jgi:mitochondrial inner membrane protease subunit 1